MQPPISGTLARSVDESGAVAPETGAAQGRRDVSLDTQHPCEHNGLGTGNPRG